MAGYSGEERRSGRDSGLSDRLVAIETILSERQKQTDEERMNMKANQKETASMFSKLTETLTLFDRKLDDIGRNFMGLGEEVKKNRTDLDAHLANSKPLRDEIKDKLYMVAMIVVAYIGMEIMKDVLSPAVSRFVAPIAGPKTSQSPNRLAALPPVQEEFDKP
jgi:hypothetical protein